jgi:hypothetical protein
MKMKIVLCSIIAVGLAGLVGGCASEKHEAKQDEAMLQAEAKVSRADAEKAALAKVPGGTIKDGELEKEKGKLIYSFDISTPGTTDIMEIHVDAITGQVIAMDKETAAKEAKEKQGEEKEEKKK